MVGPKVVPPFVAVPDAEPPLKLAAAEVAYPVPYVPAPVVGPAVPVLVAPPPGFPFQPPVLPVSAAAAVEAAAAAAAAAPPPAAPLRFSATVRTAPLTAVDGASALPPLLPTSPGLAQGGRAAPPMSPPPLREQDVYAQIRQEEAEHAARMARLYVQLQGRPS
eukprot:TRINITY_DN4139_c2_g1_i2.p1 TRINITY_DN4139_c2_g1~~TRINITY_DN4139_c2_g1_i2.p1  ORF type:complete len:163 (+),score=29.52 TRINITY_DN4139_c2_g1_i2:306-794(+)